MTANTNPIYSLTPVIATGKTIATVNTAVDGTGTIVTLFTAGADGGRVEKVRARALGTNVASVLRIFINNGGSNTVAANNILWDEITLPTTTISQVAQLLNQEIVLNLTLPANYTLFCTLGTTVAAGYAVCAIGGSY